MHYRKIWVVFIVTILAGTAYGGGKKLIGFGWDLPNPVYLRDHIEKFEKEIPFDGIGVFLDREDKRAGRYLFNNEKIDYGYLQQHEDILKGIKFHKFTDNFIYCTTRGDALTDWFDDSAWKNIIHNFAIFARLARKSGFKGLVLDFEQYNHKHFSFAVRQGEGRTFRETAEQVRKRGRQVMEAMTGEYPDITIFMLFGFSLCSYAAEADESSSVLPYMEAGLLVPFLNGFLDLLNPRTILIDGCETDGYKATKPVDYYRILHKMKLLKKLVSPENKDKFMTQYHLACSNTLDPYFSTRPAYKNWNFYSGLTLAQKNDKLRRNLAYALDISDEYAWTWYEWGKWFGTKPYQGLPSWESISPGITQAIFDAKDRIAATRRMVREGKFKNLFPCSRFSETKQIYLYCPPGGTGYLSFVGEGYESNNGIKISGAGLAAAVQGAKVEEGSLLYIRGMAKNIGNGVPSLKLGWKNADGAWGGVPHEIYFGKDVGNGWRRAEGFVRVPPSITDMVVEAQVQFQKGAGDYVIFDDVEAYATDW